jgi:CheY-like chemotaxis protein
MTKKILLADDSVTIQKVIELTFMDQDCEIVAVSNGDEAMGRLEDPAGEPFDLVIADVHMPGANGYEVARRSKDLSPHIPVLLLVGTFEPFDEDQFEASGSNEYLKKPFESQDLLQRVDALLSAAPAAGTTGAGGVGDSGFDGMAGMPTAEEPDMAPAFGLPPVDEEDDGADLADLDLGDEDGDDLAFGGDLGAVELGDREEETSGLGDGDDAWGDLDLTGAASTQVTPPGDEDPDEGDDEADDGAVFALEDEEPSSSFSIASEEGESYALEDETTEPAAPPEPPHPTAATISISNQGDEATHATQADAVPEDAPAEGTTPPAPTVTSAVNGSGSLSDSDVDRIARRVVDLLGERVLREVAWEVVPDLAEVVIRDRIRELESEVE